MILPLYLMWTIMSMCVWTLINMVRLFLPLGILIEKKVKSNHKKINFTFFKKYMRAWIAIYALQQHTFHKALHEVSWREALQSMPSCIFQKWKLFLKLNVKCQINHHWLTYIMNRLQSLDRQIQYSCSYGPPGPSWSMIRISCSTLACRSGNIVLYCLALSAASWTPRPTMCAPIHLFSYWITNGDAPPLFICCGATIKTLWSAKCKNIIILITKSGIMAL